MNTAFGHFWKKTFRPDPKYAYKLDGLLQDSFHYMLHSAHNVFCSITSRIKQSPARELCEGARGSSPSSAVFQRFAEKQRGRHGPNFRGGGFQLKNSRFPYHNQFLLVCWLEVAPGNLWRKSPTVDSFLLETPCLLMAMYTFRE